MHSLDFSIFPNLETERLILRQLKTEDVEAVFFLRSDANVLRFIGKEPVKDLNEAADFIKRVNEESVTGKTILWGIALKEDAGLVIGTICFWNIDKQNERAELGYALHPDYWRKGIMKEAILKLLDYGFKEMKLHSVEARTSPENIPSASLLGTTGFLKEGHLKEVLCFRGEFYDSIIYSKVQ
jgi:ribosomal-protein-alanine N-acetyltransferase